MHTVEERMRAKFAVDFMDHEPRRRFPIQGLREIARPNSHNENSKAALLIGGRFATKMVHQIGSHVTATERTPSSRRLPSVIRGPGGEDMATHAPHTRPRPGSAAAGAHGAVRVTDPNEPILPRQLHWLWTAHTPRSPCIPTYKALGGGSSLGSLAKQVRR